MNPPPGDENEQGQPREGGPEQGATQPIVAAVFDQRDQAEIALSDLERNGFSSNRIGVAFPTNGKRKSSRRSAAKSKKRAVVAPAGPTTGFPGWTMAMAPWVISGVAPLMVQGSLSMAGRKDRPPNLPALIETLGLREEAAETLESAFKRKSVLVTVEAADKAVIATHILERNGGHSLPRK